VAALFALGLGLFFAPVAAQEAPAANLYATNFGAPDPVNAGETITWTLQGINAGTTTLADIAWASEQCGDASYPGPFAPGESTPLVTCESTAPSAGTAANTTHFTATDVGSSEVLAQVAAAEVTVAEPPTTTTTTPAPPTSAGSSVDIGDAVQQSLGAESSRGELPRTGTNPAPLLLGLAAAAAGGLLLVPSRTRHR
jgi:LPXTG-motif cell wall-anchored protein